MVATSISDCRYTLNSQFLCRARVSITPTFDGPWLQGVSIGIDIATKDLAPVSGRWGVSPPMHFHISFPLQGGEHKQRVAHFSMRPNDGHLRIENFSLPSTVLGRGVARHLWHRIVKSIPLEVRRRIVVSGSLSPHDAEREGNEMRRDALWKALIRFGVDPQATFQENCSGAEGWFAGYLNDPWNSEQNHVLVCEPVECSESPRIV